MNTVMAMDAPATIKDVQKLTSCMAALNRFLSRLGERGLPFFKLLKRQDKFEWTTEAVEALENLKHHCWRSLRTHFIPCLSMIMA